MSCKRSAEYIDYRSPIKTQRFSNDFNNNPFPSSSSPRFHSHLENISFRRYVSVPAIYHRLPLGDYKLGIKSYSSTESLTMSEKEEQYVSESASVDGVYSTEQNTDRTKSDEDPLGMHFFLTLSLSMHLTYLSFDCLYRCRNNRRTE